MDILKNIEKLAQKARNESVPDLAISNKVMAKIEQEGNSRINFAAFDLFAAISAAAALIALIIGMQVLVYAKDPVVELFATLQESPLW